MMKRTPVVAFIVFGMYVGAFGQSTATGSVGSLLGTLVGVSIVAFVVFRMAYGRAPFSQPAEDAAGD